MIRTGTLAGFSRFAVAFRAERRGHNPQTGEVIIIPAHKVPEFAAGKTLQEVVQPLNNKNQETANQGCTPQRSSQRRRRA